MIKLKLRARRKIRLGLLGFSPTEANALAKSTRERYALKRPYIKRMIKDRQVLVKQAREEDWSKARYRREVRAIYDEMGWGKKITRSSAWRMWRHFYDISVQKKDKDMTPDPEGPIYDPDKPHSTKAQRKAQKQRAKERRGPSQREVEKLHGYIAGSARFDFAGKLLGGVKEDKATGKFTYEVR